MNDNIARHKILRELSKITIENDIKSLTKSVEDKWYLSFDELSKKTKLSDLEIRKSVSTLFINKEIFLCENEPKGLLILEDGLSAYSDKKYIKIFQKNIIQIIKDCVQIFIPVFSMIIALVAVSNNDSKKIEMFEKELLKTQIKIINMEKDINKHTKRNLMPKVTMYNLDTLKTK